MKLNKEKIILLLYLPIGLSLLYFLFTNFTDVLSFDYIILLFLAGAVSFYPIRMSNTIVLMLTGISLVTFVIFGLGAEIILTSIAVSILILRMNKRSNKNYSYALNLLMVAFLSTISAISYNYVDSLFKGSNPIVSNLFPLFVYITVHMVMNRLIAYLYEFSQKKENIKFATKELKLSLAINYSFLSFFYILLIQYDRIGMKGLLLGFLPFLTLAAGLSMWSKSEMNNLYLNEVTEANYRLTTRKNYDETINCFIHSLVEIFQSEGILYFEKTAKDKMQIKRDYNFQNNKGMANSELVIPKDSAIDEIFHSDSMTHYSLENYMEYFTGLEILQGKKALIIPIYTLNQKKGLILMVEPKNLLSETYMDFLLKNYIQNFLNILENVQRLENLEKSSYTDGLTGLPNFRYFLEEIELAEKKEVFSDLSVMVLDLDYFKDLNDRHGHQAGNDVLKQLSELFKRYMNNNCFVARYGGEEFVFLLKGYTEKEVYDLGESIREEIEKTKFHAEYSILENKAVDLSITISIGFSIADKNTQNIYDLMALADEAMYLGSKRNGRNRVTAYRQGL